MTIDQAKSKYPGWKPLIHHVDMDNNITDHMNYYSLLEYREDEEVERLEKYNNDHEQMVLFVVE